MSNTFILACCTLVVHVVIICLVLYAKYHPLEPFKGFRRGSVYRSKWAEKSEEAWEFAQELYQKYAIRSGICMIASGIVCIILTQFFSDETAYALYGVYFAIMIATCIALFVSIEIKLRMNFDENGYRMYD